MTGKRPPGRPPLDPEDTSVLVGVTLPTRQFDGYAKRALHDDVSVPEIIRRDLHPEKKSNNPEDPCRCHKLNHKPDPAP